MTMAVWLCFWGLPQTADLKLLFQPFYKELFYHHKYTVTGGRKYTDQTVHALTTRKQYRIGHGVVVILVALAFFYYLFYKFENEGMLVANNPLDICACSAHCVCTENSKVNWVNHSMWTKQSFTNIFMDWRTAKPSWPWSRHFNIDGLQVTDVRGEWIIWVGYNFTSLLYFMIVCYQSFVHSYTFQSWCIARWQTYVQ